MATSIEQIEQYINDFIDQNPPLSVISKDDLKKECLAAVWPIIKARSNELDFNAFTDQGFIQALQSAYIFRASQQKSFDSRDRYAVRRAYPEFIYESFSYSLNDAGLIAHFVYKLGEYTFNPSFRINPEDISNTNIEGDFLDALVFNFGIMNAINYYKLSCSPIFTIRAGQLSKAQQEFFKKQFYYGLGEFMYINELQLDYETFMTIQCEEPEQEPHIFELENDFYRNLIPIGGGKDSVVTLEALRSMRDKNVVYRFDRSIYPSDRAAISCIQIGGYTKGQDATFRLELDPKMLELNRQGFYNGHIPFSSCLAFSALITAYLRNCGFIVLSNEASANEGNIAGTTINHQYSKSFEFEHDFQEYVATYLTDRIHYFSLLRCINEFQIVQRFVKLPQYHSAFRSCNAGTHQNRWCGQCAKCLYVFIMLAPFLPIETLIDIFGHNMLDDKKLTDIFIGLVKPDATKPFECVGTREEIAHALNVYLAHDFNQPLPALLKLYRDELKVPTDANQVENYFNPQNAIPDAYLQLIMGMPR